MSLLLLLGCCRLRSRRDRRRHRVRHCRCPWYVLCLVVACRVSCVVRWSHGLYIVVLFCFVCVAVAVVVAVSGVVVVLRLPLSFHCVCGSPCVADIVACELFNCVVVCVAAAASAVVAVGVGAC